MQRNDNNNSEERAFEGPVPGEDVTAPADAGAAQEGTCDAAADDIDTLKKMLADAQADAGKKAKEIAELKDLMQRRQADFENYKKRVLKSQEENRKYAIKDLALDIITINDDLLRAVEASSTVKNGESIEQSHRSFVDGVLMISRMMEEALGKYNIVEIDHLNQVFDPQYNEAVEIVTGDSVKEDTITKIYQKGFMLDDLVLRSARVQVTRALPGEQKEAAVGKD
jgi:molecular chaperone GrpE